MKLHCDSQHPDWKPEASRARIFLAGSERKNVVWADEEGRRAIIHALDANGDPRRTDDGDAIYEDFVGDVAIVIDPVSDDLDLNLNVGGGGFLTMGLFPPRDQSLLQQGLDILDDAWKSSGGCNGGIATRTYAVGDILPDGSTAKVVTHVPISDRKAAFEWMHLHSNPADAKALEQRTMRSAVVPRNDAKDLLDFCRLSGFELRPYQEDMLSKLYGKHLRGERHVESQITGKEVQITPLTGYGGDVVAEVIKAFDTMGPAIPGDHKPTGITFTRDEDGVPRRFAAVYKKIKPGCLGCARGKCDECAPVMAVDKADGPDQTVMGYATGGYVTDGKPVGHFQFGGGPAIQNMPRQQAARVTATKDFLANVVEINVNLQVTAEALRAGGAALVALKEEIFAALENELRKFGPIKIRAARSAPELAAPYGGVRPDCIVFDEVTDFKTAESIAFNEAGTKATMKSLAMQLIESHGKDAARDVLRGFGVDKFGELKPEQYNFCIGRLRDALARPVHAPSSPGSQADKEGDAVVHDLTFAHPPCAAIAVGLPHSRSAVAGAMKAIAARNMLRDCYSALMRQADRVRGPAYRRGIRAHLDSGLQTIPGANNDSGTVHVGISTLKTVAMCAAAYDLFDRVWQEVQAELNRPKKKALSCPSES